MRWDLQLKTLPLFKGHQVHLINPLKVTPPISLFGQVHLHTHNTCKMGTSLIYKCFNNAGGLDEQEAAVKNILQSTDDNIDFSKS